MSNYHVASEPAAAPASQPDVATPSASSSACCKPNTELRRLALAVISAIDEPSDPLLRVSLLVMERIHDVLRALEAEPEEKLLLDAALDVCAPPPAPAQRLPSVACFSPRACTRTGRTLH